ncbi:MAG: GNAT family N-acetyltransferase [Rhizomicrobium sp.]
MAAQLVIRAAQAGDLDRINALMHGSSAYRGDYYRIIEGYLVTLEYLARNTVFVAERDDAILGFYGLVVEGEPDLDLMFVSDAARGSGIGRALFDHMKETARRRGIASIRIGSHPPAASFYERMGAERCGVAPPIPGVTWERPLFKLAIAET